MKTITAREHELIIGAVGEGLTSLPEGVIEKDLFITEVLQAVAIDEDDDFRLIFCGGTCLSKAHGLIERMSEDLDFKVIAPCGLSRSARSRSLSQFKRRLVDRFVHAGFYVPAEEIIARDENGYIAMSLRYESRFAPVASLRPSIKIELNARSCLLPVVCLPVRSILEVLMAAPRSAVPCQVNCVSVDETLAEKVLSFLRRTAEARAGRNRADYDDRLVRHLYDVTAIVQSRSGLSSDLIPQHFVDMVNDDAERYRYQYPEFADDPVAQMRAALDALRDDETVFERDYIQFVDELVFGDAVSFAKAREVFIDQAERLLLHLKR